MLSAKTVPNKQFSLSCPINESFFIVFLLSIPYFLSRDPTVVDIFLSSYSFLFSS